MPLVFSSFVPHPPIIIPTIGRDSLNQVTHTVQALKKLNSLFTKAHPDLIISISPHGPIHPDTFLVNNSISYSGSLEQFGDASTYLEFDGNPMFCSNLIEQAHKNKISIQSIDSGSIDHGVLVPLYYLTQDFPNKLQLIPLSYSFTDYNSHLALGRLIYNLASASKMRIALVASGDLSHRLIPDAPAGYSPQGKIFDEQLLKLVEAKDISAILKLDNKLINEAGECGFRSLLILLGVMEKVDYIPKILSYEGPFGVGYAVIHFALK